MSSSSGDDAEAGTTTTTTDTNVPPAARGDEADMRGEKGEGAPPSERPSDDGKRGGDLDNNEVMDAETSAAAAADDNDKDDLDDTLSATSTDDDSEPEPEPRPSDERRSWLVRNLAKPVVRSSVPIRQCYEEAAQVYESFLEARHDGKLDDAFVAAMLYGLHVLHSIPKHGTYEWTEYADLQNESLERVDVITEALEDVVDKMDVEELQKEDLREMLHELEQEALDSANDDGDGESTTGGIIVGGTEGGRGRPSGAARRRAARIRGLSVDDVYMSPFRPIVPHYLDVRVLHCGYAGARNDGRLDRAYVLGIQYWLCATKVIPTHPHYESNEHARWKRESLDRANAVFVAIGEIEGMMDREEEEELERLVIGDEAEAEANSTVRLGGDGPDDPEAERARESRILRRALEKERAERLEVTQKYEALQAAYEALKGETGEGTAASANHADREKNVGHRRSSSNSDHLVPDPPSDDGPTNDPSGGSRLRYRRRVLADIGSPNQRQANDGDEGTRKDQRGQALTLTVHRGRAENSSSSTTPGDLWDRFQSPITVDWRNDYSKQPRHRPSGAALGRQPALFESEAADDAAPSDTGADTDNGTASKRARPSAPPKSPPAKRPRRGGEGGRRGSRRQRGGAGAAPAGGRGDAHVGASGGTINCRPTEECDGLMRSVDAKEADGLDVFENASSHFGDVHGGKGSYNRTWVLCHCCATCRAHPRRAFVTSYKGTRAGSVFFDFRTQEIPKEARDQLHRHLMDQTKFRKVQVEFPPYCPP